MTDERSHVQLVHHTVFLNFANAAAAAAKPQNDTFTAAPRLHERLKALEIREVRNGQPQAVSGRYETAGKMCIPLPGGVHRLSRNFGPVGTP